ncbi:MAG: hypothetical protein ACI841_002113 [Planctomycetota bacterium]|jgi:hypothetical protein
MPMISEVARGVLAEMEAQVDGLRTQIDLVNRYQREVFERQIEAEAAQPGSFISDRAFCNLAYAAQHSTILGEIFSDPRLSSYMESVRDGLVFFLRPHRSLLADDGVRERLDWEEVLRIDGMVKLMLEMFSIPHISVASLSMQERIRTCESVLSLAGVGRDQLRAQPVGGAAAFRGSSGAVGNGNGNGRGNGKSKPGVLTPVPAPS